MWVVIESDYQFPLMNRKRSSISKAHLEALLEDWIEVYRHWLRPHE
jgi:hypothetical protein